MTKEQRELCKAIERQGVRVLSMRITGKNHLALRLSNGKREINYIAGGTPSDHRAVRNALAEINRYFKEHA